jgi:RNA polymerase sigma-B factor
VQAYSTSSLDTPVGEDGIAPVDVLGEDDPSIETLEGWASVAPALQELPPRERRVLYLRFFEGLTQSEIAEQVGVSQMHVSRILAQTLRFLRERAQTDPPRGSASHGADQE